MDHIALRESLRQADTVSHPELDVDDLVSTATRVGRRRVVLHRSLIGGCAVTLVALTAAGVTLNDPQRATTTWQPAGPPSSTPSASQSPTRSAGTFPSDAMLEAAFRTAIGSEGVMTHVTPVPGHPTITFTLGDDQRGRSWAGGGVGRTTWSDWSDSSSATDGCREADYRGARLLTCIDTEKVGDGHWYYLIRADGTYVWFGERNAFDGNGPATRDELPLDDTQVRAVLDSPVWDRILADLPTSAPTGSGRPSGKR